MDKLIGGLIAVFVGLMLLAGALMSIPFWAPGVGMNFACAAIASVLRAQHVRQPDILAKVLDPRWNEAESAVKWSINSSALEKQVLAIPFSLFAVVPGVLVLVLQLPGLFAQKRPDGLDEFFLKAAGCIMAVGGTVLAVAAGQDWIPKACKSAIQSVVDEFASSSEQFSALKEAENQVRALAGQIGVNWPIGLSEDIRAYIERERQQALLLDGATFRERVTSALDSARTDAQMLTTARDQHNQTLSEFRSAAREANRSGAMTLVEELEGMHEAIMSNAMMSLLANRRWNEFGDVHREMSTDLSRIVRQARQYQAAGNENTPKADSALRKAIRVLGISEDTSPEAIKKRYKQLATDYHPDKAAQATAAIRALAEERFKEINEAWQIVQREMNIT